MSAPLWYRYTVYALMTANRRTRLNSFMGSAEGLHHTIDIAMPFGRNSLAHSQCKAHALACESRTVKMAVSVPVNLFSCQGVEALS